MNEQIKSRLGECLKEYEERHFDDGNELKEKALRKKEFLRVYKRIIMDNIIPVMKEFSEYLESQGHGALIGNNFESRAVFMNIFPEMKRSDSHPSISFMAEEETQMITVHTKTFMHDNEGNEKYLGEFYPEYITKEFVENEIVSLIKESFSKNKNEEPYYYKKLALWK